MKECEFSELCNKILTKIVVSDKKDEIRFSTKCGKEYLMHHEQSCCESVLVEDIHGCLDDLLDEKILQAIESSNIEEDGIEDAHATWTFYNLATINGYVTIRWLGESNGYYSEKVDFAEVNSSEAQKQVDMIDNVDYKEKLPENIYFNVFSCSSCA